MTCHRCGRNIRPGDHIYAQPRRYFIRVGQTIPTMIQPLPIYHRKCVPPALFNSGREFPHEWSRDVSVTMAPFAVTKTCQRCGVSVRVTGFTELTGDNRDACPSARELAWQAVPDSSAPSPRQPA